MAIRPVTQNDQAVINPRKEFIHNILDSEKWPTPKWNQKDKEAKNIQTYEDYFTFLLQVRYVDLENDFRSVFGNYPESTDVITAELICNLLHSARELLEQITPNLLMVSNSLDLAERYMVWIYPPWLAKAYIDSILLKLSALSFKGKDLLSTRLIELSKKEHEGYPGEIRSVLDEAIGSINREVVQDRISRGLQTNRLKLLRLWGLVALAIFLLGSPLAININTNTSTNHVISWPSQKIIGESNLLIAWTNALAMLLMGAVGGFLSGLLQARNTQITLSEYLESILKLQLRPLVGGLIALILYTILSWQVLPGITIESAGSFFVIAFLSGFSERYFLRLLDIKEEDEKSSEESDSISSTNLTTTSLIQSNNPANEYRYDIVSDNKK